MSATLRLIEAISVKYPNEDGTPASDYRIAKMLDISREAVSQYRRTGNQFGVKQACKAADLLGRDPMEVIAEVEKDRAKSDSDRDFWGGQLRRMGVAAAVGLCMVHTAFFSGNADASTLSSRSVVSTEIYITRLSRRVRQWARQLLQDLNSPIGLFAMSPA